MKAIVHIGMEKTGTTTIQQFLGQNRAALARQGIAFPESPGPRNHRSLASYCMEDDQIDDHILGKNIKEPAARARWRQAFQRELAAEMAALPAGTHTLLLSSEHLQSRLQNSAGVERFRDLIAPHVSAVTIVVYLRRQDAAAMSRYSTAVRAGRIPRAILPPTAAPDHPFYNYQQLVERWAGVFGREAITVKLFDPGEFQGGDLLQDFAATVGFRIGDDMALPERANETLSARVQEALLLINRAFPPRSADNELDRQNRALQRYITEQLASKYPGPPKMPTREQARAFYGLFEASNTALARDYLGRDTLFSTDFSRYPETPQDLPLDKDVMADVLALLASRLRHRRRPGTALANLLTAR